MIYSIVLAPLLALALVSALVPDQDRRLYRLAPLFVIALVLIAGFRDGTGTDTRTYEAMWRGISPLHQVLTGERLG